MTAHATRSGGNRYAVVVLSLGLLIGGCGSPQRPRPRTKRSDKKDKMAADKKDKMGGDKRKETEGEEGQDVTAKMPGDTGRRGRGGGPP